MATKRIGAGDSLPSIATTSGFTWETLWDRPENAELKALRKNPNTLREGDEVFIPEIEKRQESCATEERHTFKRLGDPVKFKLQLKRMGQPRKDEPFVMMIDGKIVEGTTDGDGKLEVFIPGNARTAVLHLNEGKEKHNIRIGRLDPIDELSGIKQRLNNLGFPAGIENDDPTPKATRALRNFQAHHELPVSGEADAPTVALLQTLCG